ncbi:MAG: PepSY domain-containing protein, partial [Lysobacteraceae bacterium]
ITDRRQLPWYLTALLLSQPLHFGDYGGQGMKLLWALLDIATIFILGSGLYLWLKRSRKTRAINSDRPALHDAPALARSTEAP